MKLLIFSLTFLIAFANVNKTEAHGRLLVPPARSTAWREEPNRFPAYYNDMEMFCGGKTVQWQQNGSEI